MSADSEWQHQYTTDSNIAHHRSQNYHIVNDFMIHMFNRPRNNMLNSFASAKSIIEHGCGTGEFIAEIASKAPDAECTGFDFSPDAIRLASEYKSQVKNLDYKVHDLRTNNLPSIGAELCLVSNVIEHFAQWSAVVDKLVDAYQSVLIIVPYEERIDHTSGPSAEDGGGGHCHSFNRNSFMRYTIVEDMVFFSLNGWGVSHAGECPLLYAILLKKKQ